MKTRHDEDCSYYSSLHNARPEDGICTCGYGLQYIRDNNGDCSEMYSRELRSNLFKGIKKPSIVCEDLIDKIRKSLGGKL